MTTKVTKDGWGTHAGAIWLRVVSTPVGRVVLFARERVGLLGNPLTAWWFFAPNGEDYAESSGLMGNGQAVDPVPLEQMMGRAEACLDAYVARINSSRPVLMGSSVRPEVAAFAAAMEAKLRENAHKGGWHDEDVRWLLAKLMEECGELARAACTGLTFEPADRAAILKEAADVGNCAMMVASVKGALAAPKPDGP